MAIAELAFTDSLTGRHEVIITDKSQSKKHVCRKDDVEYNCPVTTLGISEAIARKLFYCQRSTVGQT